MDIGLGDQSFKKGITQYTFFALREKKTGQGKGALRSYPLDPLPRIAPDIHPAACQKDR